MKKILMTLLVGLPLSVMAQTTTNHLSEVTVNVQTPGTLGDLILQQTENLADVVTLHLGGSINDADLTTLQTRLTRMRNLDALQLQMTEIPKDFMYNHDTLRTMVLPSSATIVHEYAFYDCDSLKSITLPEGLIELQRMSFYYCQKLENLQLPSTLKIIGDNAFYYCRRLTKAILPEGLESLGDGAFSTCNSLKEVYIPAGLKVIPNSAFAYAYELESLTIPEGIESIGNTAFYNAFWYNSSTSGDKQIHLTMPSTLKSIGVEAFGNNRNIVEINLNEGLEFLGRACFEYANLSEVTIPSTVRYARSVFYECNNLKRIICKPLVPPVNYNYNFVKGSNTADVEGCTLVVPAATINEYKQTTGYDHYAAYESIDYLPSEMTVNRDFRFVVPASNQKIGITMVLDRNDGCNGYDGMGTLTVEGTNTLNIGRLTMYGTPYDIDNYYKFAYYNDSNNPYGTNPTYNLYYKKGFTSIIANAPMQADNVDLSLRLFNNYWAFISLPYDVKVGDIEILNEKGGQFVIRRYDGVQRAAGNSSATWQQLGAGDVMYAGQGYIVRGVGYYTSGRYVYSEELKLRFPSMNGGSKDKLFTTSDGVVTLTDYPAEFEHNRGWNLVGNPYPCYVNGAKVSYDAPITIWNTNYQRYQAIRLTDDVYVFSPFEAFFTQCNAATAMTFHKEGRQLSLSIEEESLGARQMTNGSRKVFNVTLQRGDDQDRTRFVINPDAKLYYELDKDASWMQSLRSDISSIYTCQNGVNYAINERPLHDGKIALGLQLAVDGIYTLGLQTKESDAVMLTDMEEGTTIRLDQQDYAFTAKAGILEGRFIISLGNATDGVQSVTPASTTSGEVYNLQGQRVNASRKGVFIQNGKKIVIK